MSDSRYIIDWVEYPDESQLNTEDKINDYQEMLRWLGCRRISN